MAALATASVAIFAQSFVQPNDPRQGWNLVPSIVVVSAEGDPRLPLVGEAMAFWNSTFSELGIGFRLGALTQIIGTIPVDDLKMLRTPFLEPPESIRRIKGNIVVVLSDGEFISFAARQPMGDKVVVAIKDFRSFPLTLPNVARNVIAHLLGVAIGLSHNADPTTLMCGRPAPCRPDLFASDRVRYFPLTEADKSNLRRMYPSNWQASGPLVGTAASGPLVGTAAAGPLFGTAAAGPLAARVQQRGRFPVIGVLWGRSNESFPEGDFRRGLADAGFVVGENVAIEFRGANSENARLPGLAADLVQRQVDVIFAASYDMPLRAAKSATTTIPIVLVYGGDPVKSGLVASLSRPGGNLTGVTGLETELGNKRLGLLHELVPGAKTIAFLTGPNQPPSDNDVLAAARTLGLDVAIINVRNNRDFGRAFMALAERRVGALFIDNVSWSVDSQGVIIALAERYKIPAIYPSSFWVRGGGLISYSPNLAGYRLAAAQFVGPILKGAKPADLPVQQPTKFGLVINLKTAKALGLTIPETLLAIADEVIE
jgi:putative ABC transport system substrate-binding protein